MNNVEGGEQGGGADHKEGNENKQTFEAKKRQLKRAPTPTTAHKFSLLLLEVTIKTKHVGNKNLVLYRMGWMGIMRLPQLLYVLELSAGFYAYPSR